MSMIERAFCRSAPWNAFTRRTVLPWALQGVTLRGDVLELGGGSGAMAEQMVRAFPSARVTVTDVDPIMVADAGRRLAGSLSAIEADVVALPLADSSYDVVTSFLMLHHVIDWPRALTEAARVLRPGGTFVGYDLGPTALATLIHVVDRSPYRLVPTHELEKSLVATGFEAVQVRPGLRGQVSQFLAFKNVT